MTAIYPYIQPPKGNFQFQPTFDGQVYNVIQTYLKFSDRFYVNIYDQSSNLIVSLPLIGSPPYQNISMTAGYFKTQLVYRPDLLQFQVI